MSNLENTVNFPKGALLLESGRDVDCLYLVIEGTVMAYSQHGKFPMYKGSFALLEDSYYGVSLYTYVAETDIKVIPINIKTISDISTFCSENTNSLAELAFAQTTHIMDLIKNYLTLIVKCRKKDDKYAPNNRLSKWELDKYNAIANMPTDIFKSYYSNLNK